MDALRLLLAADEPSADGSVDVRLTVLNQSTEPVMLDRRLLFGPHPGSGELVLLASEPATRKRADNVVLLNPSCFYGRQRRYQYDSGEITFHGYLLRDRTDVLLPTGPGDPAALLTAAPPLVIDFSARTVG